MISFMTAIAALLPSIGRASKTCLLKTDHQKLLLKSSELKRIQ
jgi:hypothetical protein